MTTLRRAVPADAPRLTALARWVWLDSYAEGGVTEAFARHLDAAFRPAAFGQLLADGQRALWVVEDADALCAMAQLCRGAPAPVAAADQPAPDVELERLYVAPPCTGRGLGRELLAAARGTWPQQALWLSVWVGNAGARRFYEREAGRRVGETDFLLDGQAHRNLVYAWSAP